MSAWPLISQLKAERRPVPQVWNHKAMATPIPRIDSLDELITLALALEREAAERYSELAEAMEKQGKEKIATLFRRLAAEENDHERTIAGWAQTQGIKSSTSTSTSKRAAPEFLPLSSDQEADQDNDALDPHLSTPYKTLAWAVRNEERAFQFFTYVAATTNNEAVRQHAESLAKEELAHAALLRTHRRRAYHAGRQATAAGEIPDASLVGSLPDLLYAAVAIEKRIARQLAAANRHGAQLTDTLETTTRILDELQAAYEKAGAPNAAMRQSLQAMDAAQDEDTTNANGRVAIAKRVYADSERAFAFYDAVVSKSASEAVMLKAQNLTEAALERIATIQSRLT